MNIEESAKRTLDLLQTVFPATGEAGVPGRMTKVPLGMEIEVPWSAYHPRLWADYFHGGKSSYDDLSTEGKEQLGALCAEEEGLLLPKITKAGKCMQMFQGRRYWEYCFPPTKDTGILLGICQLLKQQGLVPFNGPHRLQVTIGGIVPTQQAYCALMYLELKYASKERMLHGLNDQGWAIKGKAGILYKNKYDLQFGYKDGIELRPLLLPKSIEILGAMLYDCSVLADALHAKLSQCEDGALPSFCTEMARILRERGLPFKLWQNPAQEKEVWLQFASQFDSMKAELCPLPAYGFV